MTKGHFPTGLVKGGRAVREELQKMPGFFGDGVPQTRATVWDSP